MQLSHEILLVLTIFQNFEVSVWYRGLTGSYFYNILWVYDFSQFAPLLKELSAAKEEEKAAILKEQVDEGLGFLEEAFLKCSKGKAYFGGDQIGYIDIVIGSSFGWITAIGKMSGNQLIEETKTPGLFGWVGKFLSNDVVKNVMPTTEMFIELLTKMQAKATST